MTTVLLIGAAAVVVVIVGYAVLAYNRLVRARNTYQQAFAQIDVQLTRRHDLVPNLVETAKGYLRHERETLERVTAARAAAVNAQAAAGAPRPTLRRWACSPARRTSSPPPSDSCSASLRRTRT
ncbi:LemA family protein [Luedemannella flava]